MSTFNSRANALAERLLMGANELAQVAESLTESQWNTPVLGDGRSIGVVVHHVASVYPLELELAQVLASGSPITGASMDVVHQMNADHAAANADVNKADTIALLHKNSKVAANLVRAFTDEELDTSGTVSLNANAPLTAQFFIEDHALRHSYHHLDKIQKTLESMVN